MESVLDSLQSNCNALYARVGFENELETLHITVASSSRASKLRKLYDMLDAWQISYEWGKDWAYCDTLVHNSDLPSRAG